MTSRCVNPKCRQARLRPAYLAVAGLAVLIAAGGDAGARSGERTSDRIHRDAQRGRAAHGRRFAPRASGSPSTTPRGGSCGRRCRAARRDARRPPGSSASSRRSRTITRTCMTMLTCRTCNASPGRASRFMAASCRGVRRPMAVSGCHSTSPNSLFDATAMGMRVIVAPADVAPVELPIRFCSNPNRVPAPWPPPAPQRRKRRRGKWPRRGSPRRRPCGRPRRPGCRFARRKI